MVRGPIVKLAEREGEEPENPLVNAFKDLGEITDLEPHENVPEVCTRASGMCADGIICHQNFPPIFSR